MTASARLGGEAQMGGQKTMIGRMLAGPMMMMARDSSHAVE
eukprot:COSAG06_NODE_4346_length_4350_cov_12.286756_4_plen_41_part_00